MKMLEALQQIIRATQMTELEIFSYYFTEISLQKKELLPHIYTSRQLAVPNTTQLYVA